MLSYRPTIAETTVVLGIAAMALVVLAAPFNALAEDCTSSKCHKALVDKKYVHSGLEGGECTDCHVPDDDAKGVGACLSGTVFKPPVEDPTLCFECHDLKNKTDLHGAVTAGGCLACHDAHASDNPNQLSEADINELCGGCHENGQGPGRHQALDKSTCIGCHNPHSGVERPLLKKPKNTLCESCHDVQGKIMGGGHHKHLPAAQGNCVGCHEPHNAPNKPLLRRPITELCMSCHAKKLPAAQSGGAHRRIDLELPHRHGALDAGECTTCHTPHSGKERFLLRTAQPALCDECHQSQLNQPEVHSALTLGRCSKCHEPHAGANPKMLRSMRNNALCFRCHADDLTGRAHIHSPARDNCMTCHDPHGSPNARNLRRSGKELCYGCHFKVDDVKFKHAALDNFGCTGCHDPHGTANKGFLIKPVNELCATCHPDQKDGRHVPGSMTAEGHKVTGGMDPKRDQRAFSCASCHNPHGSPFAKLTYKGGGGMGICDYCHLSQTNKP